MKNDRGLTLFEIIVALLVVGILSAVIVSRISSTSVYDLKSQTEIIKSHIRYAQARAMNSTMTWGIRFDTTTSYFLYNDGDFNNKMMLPGETSDTVTLPGNITTNIPSGKTRIYSFDSWGRPCTNKAATKLQDKNNGYRQLKIQFSDLPDEKIRITDNTGFIQ